MGGGRISKIGAQRLEVITQPWVRTGRTSLVDGGHRRPRADLRIEQIVLVVSLPSGGNVLEGCRVHIQGPAMNWRPTRGGRCLCPLRTLPVTPKGAK